MKRSILLCLLPLLLHLYSCDKSSNGKSSSTLYNYRVNYKNYMFADSMSKLNKDSAFYYLYTFATNSSDSLLRSIAYSRMGIIQHDAGDYFGAQESYLQSLEFINQHPDQLMYLITIYNGLGEISRNLNNANDALYYFRKALELTKDTKEKFTLLNNIGTVYKDEENYAKAIDIYSSLLERSKQFPDIYALILSNLSHSRWLQDPRFPAETGLLTALKIRMREKDSVGLNASYSHLCDYYSGRSNDKSYFYADQMYQTARNQKNPDNQLDALGKLSDYGPNIKAKIFFRLYQKLNDSIQNVRNKAKNQFALIRYETEKHKADKLRLRKENAETQLRVLWLQAGTAILLIATVFGFLWYRRRKRQAIKEQQLRLSKKVHDKVANRVYRIMSEVEHQGLPEPGVLLYKLDAVYKQSRDISYDHSEADIQDAQQSVKELIESFASQSTRIASVGNSKEFWAHISPAAQEELSVVLEELLTNMKKHSGASNVVIKFMQKDNCIEMHYSDDGIGFSDVISYGNGLKNTETRIKGIGGTITFDKSKPGLKIRITIPIDK